MITKIRKLVNEPVISNVDIEKLFESLNDEELTFLFSTAGVEVMSRFDITSRKLCKILKRVIRKSYIKQ